MHTAVNPTRRAMLLVLLYSLPGCSSQFLSRAAGDDLPSGGLTDPNLSLSPDTDFDSGPLEPHTYYNPPGRAGFLSSFVDTKRCLTAASDGGVTSQLCAGSESPLFAVAYERLVVNGQCVTTERLLPNQRELPVSIVACRATDANQRWGYRGGTFFWGQNPNRCLDAAATREAGGRLVARMCDGSAGQAFTMHSALSDKQPALPMGPDSQFMPLGNGFLGSDAGSTTYLDFNRTLFLFNDTWVNEQGGNSRANINGFVNNTVGVMECSDIRRTQNCTIKFYFGGQQDYKQPIFERPDPGSFFWPATGALYAGSLYVTNGRVVLSNKDLGFADAGAMVARVTNPWDSPDLWDKSQMTVSLDGNVRIFSQIWQQEVPHGTWQASAEDANFAYFFNKTPTGRPLMRLPFDRLGDANAYLFGGLNAWQYLTNKMAWSPWPANASPSDIGVAATDSDLGNVNYDAEAGLYYFIGQSNNLFLAPGTYYATAPGLSGPWTPTKLLYANPEYDSASPAFIANTTCYASFSHPEMAAAGEVAFTYQCAGDQTNPKTFRQTLVRMKTPW